MKKRRLDFLKAYIVMKSILLLMAFGLVITTFILNPSDIGGQIKTFMRQATPEEDMENLQNPYNMLGKQMADNFKCCWADLEDMENLQNPYNMLGKQMADNFK